LALHPRVHQDPNAAAAQMVEHTTSLVVSGSTAQRDGCAQQVPPVFGFRWIARVAKAAKARSTGDFEG